MIISRLLIVSFALFSASCISPVKKSMAPIINSAGEPVVLKPSNFKISSTSRRSDVIKLGEDIVKSMPSDFPTNIIKLAPEKDEKVLVALLMLGTDVKEKVRSGKTGVIVPLVAVKHMNISQERIDAAIPSIQRAYYNKLKTHGRLIPSSQLEEKK